MIRDLILQESKRQSEVINLIASENFVSKEVKSALGSDLTNKYAEGYPGARYYGGLNVIDALETEVINLAEKLFSTDYHVNVQAYSGSIANLAVYFSVLKHGDTFMGLELSDGGHLTHGHPVTVSGKLFNRIAYRVDEKTNLLNYEEIKRLATEHRPKLIISGASSYSRKIDFEKISEIAHEVGALHLADISHISGLIATGLHPSPFGNADFVMTTTHKILRGPRGALIFCKNELAKQLDKAVFPGLQGGPHMNAIAAIGVCLEEALEPSYEQYCRNVIENAKLLSQELMNLGLKLVTDGTDNHLFLIDLRPLGITGQVAQDKLERVKIIVNKNAIPYDTSPPQNPSGIRIGTCAITTKNISQNEIANLAKKINDTLRG
ncbi:serine hydroxymethyltransferase [Candidatus Berkelbacteria bacterium]|nr:serine hydroxymethyltransferase [Candidatus Berkelbacteria bacterium]